MNFDVPKTNIPKKPENISENYQQEAMVIAQRMSQRWQELREKMLKDPHLLASSAKLNEINAASKPPIPGIRTYFEGQIKFIDAQAGDASSRSRMMYRLKEEMEQLEKSLDEVLG